MARSLALLLGLVAAAAPAGRCAAAESATDPAAVVGATDLAAHPGEHEAATTLAPIATTLAGLRMTDLEALPVQNGGRYKPLHAFAMETISAITGSAALPGGHTPVSSLLDLLFCRSVYDTAPLVAIKNPELCRDLAHAVPAEERARLVQDGLITPRRLADASLQAALTDLSRQNAKSKAVNDVRRAYEMLDTGTVIASLAIFATPAGPLSDHWRSPADLASDLPTTLQRFCQQARAAHGSLDQYGQLTWATLPLSSETADVLGLSGDAYRSLNLGTLWQIWQAAGSAGGLDPATIRDLADHPAQAVGRLGFASASEAGDGASQAIADLTVLRQRWPALRIGSDDCADPALLARATAAADAACSAWSELGAAWYQARTSRGGGGQALQSAIDHLVASCGALQRVLDAHRQALHLPALRMDTALELAYWRWHFSDLGAYLFLLAIPLLALGSIGRQRLALQGGYVLAGAGLVTQASAFVIRAILAQRVPLANLYESMAAAALLASLVALVAETILSVAARRARRAQRPSPPAQGAFALAASLFGCNIVLAQVFMERHDINAFISPVMPILSEFWLRIHTACVVSSYGLIALGGLMSTVYLLMRLALPWDDARSLAWDRATFAITSVAAVVLWVGLCLGAVWAAESWGRPWGWDPKEVFALLTWVVFVILVHLRHATPARHRGLATACTSLGAMLVMVFNWYFVNVQLAGLHSYA
jgi:ABC-type transport system involved in cytochrome c biogenesis permease subunit